MPRAQIILCLAPIVLFGAIGGFFYAYSVSVMIGLDALPELQAIHAMQLLNQGTRNAVFLVTFLFTPIITFCCAIALFFTRRRWSALLLLAAVIVYFFGSFLPTVGINVPLNHALEALVPSEIPLEDAPGIWEQYRASWTFWNTVRATMALLALLLSGLAMYFLPRPRTPSPEQR
ncbi:DUF1772 domain-containing protein (plasmid) [Aliiroseovarius crassostreae]|uniref:anthrone oxygenase family protein n=2 Tax=Aliiroseovarius crassostreae TaxID=154981 RepID=UPI002204CD7A|nr:anthrone oxygenase family protein [Aliiroseovarius crassostreae]UWQ03538.1 DUF1772 domain-containing protein [Aliiroseovarius crassostreae]